jgi:hypothetical protein
LSPKTLTNIFTDAELRESCQDVSPPGMATAPPTTAGLAFRTPTVPNVTGSPKRPSRTTTTRATACSPLYYPECEVSTGASKLGPERLKNSFYLKAIRLINSHH